MKKVWSYLIAAATCLVVAVIYMLAYGVFTIDDTALLYKVLCNAFFIPGILMALFGGLVFCTNEGALDMLAFGFSKLFDLFRKKDQIKYHTYYDYKQSKKDKRTGKGAVTAMVVVGVAFVLLSMVFLYLGRKL